MRARTGGKVLVKKKKTQPVVSFEYLHLIVILLTESPLKKEEKKVKQMLR